MVMYIVAIMLLRSPVPSPETPIDFNEVGVYPRVVRIPGQALPDIEIDLLGPEDVDALAVTPPDLLDMEPRDEEIPALFREIAAELALHDVEQELEAEVTALGPQLSGEPKPAIHSEMLERERAFFTKVFMAATEMAERQTGPVTLLFDVDYTVVQNDSRTVRPAFALVIRELSNILGDRLELGILSTRTREGSGELELDDPIGRTPIAGDKLNPDFLFSSLDLERSDPSVRSLVYGNNTIAQIEAAKDVLDPEVIEAIKSGELSTESFYDSKLLVLQGLVSGRPDRAFVLVDDLPVADVLKSKSPNIGGVRVNAEILDKTLQPYSKAAI